MALLSNGARQLAQTAFVQELMEMHETIGVTKADLAAAVAGLDSYLDTNAAAINQAIPQPARGALTVKQKARLLMYVIRQRYLAEA